MKKADFLIIADYTQVSPLSLRELCEICNVTTTVMHDLIELDIVRPQGGQPEDWLFDMQQVRRLKTAIRLQRDLEVNWVGVGLVLDLLDEMDELRKQTEIFEKHFLR